jgi:hypothetical protein
MGLRNPETRKVRARAPGEFPSPTNLAPVAIIAIPNTQQAMVNVGIRNELTGVENLQPTTTPSPR